MFSYGAMMIEERERTGAYLFELLNVDVQLTSEFGLCVREG
jgi:hypothetical protein